MTKLRRFLFIYALAFSVIWIGYGIYSIVTNQPNAINVLVFGIAFAGLVSATSWFSYWLMGHYKRIDKLAKETFSNAKKSKSAQLKL